MSEEVESKEWNPRYVAYARAHGRTPDAMLEHDREKYPGGCMCGFILWMSKMQQAFYAASPGSFLGHTICDHAAWDVFLQAAADRGEVLVEDR